MRTRGGMEGAGTRGRSHAMLCRGLRVGLGIALP